MYVHRTAQSVAAQGETNMRKADEMANRLDLMLREALVKAVQNIERLPEPRHIISDTHRAHRRPAHQLGELIALLKIGGLKHYDAMVFVSKVVVGFVDVIYADEHLPSFEELVPRLIEETAESEVADVRAIASKSPVDYARAAEEGTEAIVLQTIVQRKRASECAVRKLAMYR